MGYLRDDWFLLWNALDPTTAPPGASGVFFRPLADGLWWLAASVGGDHPLAMHLPMLVLATAAAALAGSIARRLGATEAAAWLAAAGIGTHAALLEIRLWAAASNGLLALVLALAGWWWALRSSRGRVVGIGLVLLAGLARVDAWAFLLPVAMTLDRGRRPALGVAAAVAVVGLGWSLGQADAGWTLDATAAVGGLRRLVVPWGGPQPFALEAGIAGLAVAGLVVLARRGAGRPGLLLPTLLVPVALAVLPWGGAGRYLMVPVATGMILLACTLPPRWTWPVAAVLMLHAATPWFGSAAADLRARSRAETGLYRVVRQERPVPPVRLVDPPPLGWTDSPADAENVVSTALRRMVEVEFVEAPVAGDLRWETSTGSWRRP